jgi:hypothetical protein
MRMPAIAIAAILGTLSAPASADTKCPSGHYSVIRISQLTKGGTEAGFKAAMADHARWYADHGYTADTFSYGSTANLGASTYKNRPTPGEYVTFHTNASSVPADQHDAGWKAFVAKYAANSRILKTLTVCMAE